MAEKSINARNHLVYGSIKYIVKCVRSNPRITSPDEIYDTVMDVLSDMAENAFKYNPSKNVKFITYMQHIINDKIPNMPRGFQQSTENLFRATKRQ